MNGRKMAWAAGLFALLSLALPPLFYFLLGPLNLPGQPLPSQVPAQAIPQREQLVTLLGSYLVKPVYMFLSGWLVWLLWRRREDWREKGELGGLFWGLLAFFLGEMACWVNFTLLGDRSLLMEYLHSVGMALAVAGMAYSTIQVADRRLLRYSDPQGRCAFLEVCRGCIKTQPVPCGLQRTFQVTIGALLLVSFMPLEAEFTLGGYAAQVFGYPHVFAHALAYQAYEIRFAPLAASFLFSAALLAESLPKRRYPAGESWAKFFLAGGLGYLSFGLMRLAFISFYRDHLAWFVFWEELTELLLVAAIGASLYFFRMGLLLESKSPKKL